jgi:branched-chain amino acid aminotransferase
VSAGSRHTGGSRRGAPAREPRDYPAIVGGRLLTVGEATIPAADDGLLRGDGAFEVVRAYGGRPFALDEHLARLERTCATIRLPLDRAALTRDVAAAVAALGDATFDLRIVLTRGGQRLVLAEPVPALPAVLRLALVVDTARRVLGGAKTLSYAGNMLARRLAQERGFDEALLVTPDGRILELQTASFFYVAADGALCTPPLTGEILDSITRRVLLRLLPVEERVCMGDDLRTCREAFAASAAREAQPVAAIEEHVFADAPGPVTRAAQDAFWAEVEASTGFVRR